MKERKIIIDCDPGFDDALALFILYKNSSMFDIKMICSTAGNTPIEKTTRNVQFFAENFFNGTIVAKGMSDALQKVNNHGAEEVHGDTGLGNFDPGDQTYPYEENSTEAMYTILKKSRTPITLVTLGPMTNIANLLLKHPDIKNKIECIYSMIGSIDGTGNVKPYAEFNTWFDAEALDIVLQSNIPITFNPMQLAENARIPRDIFDNHIVDSTIQSMIKTMMEGVIETKDPKSIFVYDANTICALIKPDLYDYVPCDATVSTKPSTYGKTIMKKNPKGIHKYQVVKDKELLKQFILDNIFSL